LKAGTPYRIFAKVLLSTVFNQALSVIGFFVILILYSTLGYSQSITQLKRVCTDGVGTNTLTWNTPSDTCAKVLGISIYASTDVNSNYSIIDSLTSNAVQFVHSSASTYLNGRYFICYSYLCTGDTIRSCSNIIMVDVVTPSAIDPDSVSFNADNTISIGWTAEKSADVASYVVYRVTNALNVPYTEVIGISNTYQKDSDLTYISRRIIDYRLAVRDSCNNLGAIGTSHLPMYLALNQDTCTNSVTVSWNAYKAWMGENVNYQVFYKRANRSYTIIGSTTSTSFKIDTLSKGQTYYFYVRAVNLTRGFTASSNRDSIVINASTQAEVYLKRVTTNDENKISVSWYNLDFKNISEYQIYNTDNPKSGLWVRVGIVKPAGIFDSIIDFQADPLVLKYYKIIPYNLCGIMGKESNISTNIILEIKQSSVFFRKVTWNKYTGWLGKDSLYELQRLTTTISGALVWQTLKVGNRDFTFFDDTAYTSLDLIPGKGICYRLLILEGYSSKYPLFEFSRSNVDCNNYDPSVFIPNAFYNKSTSQPFFKPSLYNADLSRSYLIVYNRWGQFITKANVIEGWDGKLPDGSFAMGGVYSYFLYVKGYNGFSKAYTGNFSLID